MLDRLKWYMRPFYQSGDDAVLQSYLTEFSTSEAAASVLWAELPGFITSGAIKSYDTGASSTEFNDPVKVAQFCRERSKYFAERARGSDFSLAALVEKEYAVGGVRE